jgi:putative serine protease PepD
MRRPLFPILLAALLGGAVAAVLLTGGGARSSAPATSASASAASSGSASSSGTRREAASTTPSATQIYQRDAAGVVSIKAVTAEGADSGTGIVLNEKGLILTNDHVIAGASSITVAPGDSSSSSRSATLVGEEANKDLALIRVDPSGLGLKPLKLVSSSSVQVGDTVYAIGNPYGLNETLTKGIVSALDREISAPDGAPISGAIQTDAALNPGNSGGPLLNEQGDVIGVNSQIASDAASGGGSQPGSTGVGFAISSNTVAQVVKTIEAGQGVSASAGSRSRLEAQGGEGAQSPYGGRSPYGPEGGEAEQGGSNTEGEGQAAPGVEGPAASGGEGRVEVNPRVRSGGGESEVPSVVVP